MDTPRLLFASLADLLAEAAAVRDAARVTWSPKVFIPLTTLCRDKCDYRTFTQPPTRLDAPYLTPEKVLASPPRSSPFPKVDYLVIDAPALDGSAAVLHVVTVAEGTLLTARSGTTTARTLRSAAAQIPRDRVLGVTLMDAED